MTDRISMYRAYLDKKPNDRFALYSLAFELGKAGHITEAEHAFADLLDKHPQSGAGHFQLGSLLEADGREDEARVAWERGLAALEGCDDPEARRSRVEIQAALDLL